MDHGARLPVFFCTLSHPNPMDTDAPCFAQHDTSAFNMQNQPCPFATYPLMDVQTATINFLKVFFVKCLEIFLSILKAISITVQQRFLSIVNSNVLSLLKSMFVDCQRNV
jgi:hypothetical protein